MSLITGEARSVLSGIVERYCFDPRCQVLINKGDEVVDVETLQHVLEEVGDEMGWYWLPTTDQLDEVFQADDGHLNLDEKWINVKIKMALDWVGNQKNCVIPDDVWAGFGEQIAQRREDIAYINFVSMHYLERVGQDGKAIVDRFYIPESDRIQRSLLAENSDSTEWRLVLVKEQRALVYPPRGTELNPYAEEILGEMWRWVVENRQCVVPDDVFVDILRRVSGREEVFRERVNEAWKGLIGAFELSDREAGDGVSWEEMQKFFGGVDNAIEITTAIFRTVASYIPLIKERGIELTIEIMGVKLSATTPEGAKLLEERIQQDQQRFDDLSKVAGRFTSVVLTEGLGAAMRLFRESLFDDGKRQEPELPGSFAE